MLHCFEDVLAHFCVKSYLLHPVNVSLRQGLRIQLLKGSQVDPSVHPEGSVLHSVKVYAAHLFALVHKSLLKFWQDLTAPCAFDKVD